MYTYVCDISDEEMFGGTLDPTAPGRGAHLTFDRILGRCGDAWLAFLRDQGVGDEIICPRLEIDYLREVGAGELRIDITVLSVGRSSFRLRLDVEQAGTKAAGAEVVLVAFDYGKGASVPLTESQRTALSAA